MSASQDDIGEAHVITGPEGVAAEFITPPGEVGVDRDQRRALQLRRIGRAPHPPLDGGRRA